MIAKLKERIGNNRRRHFFIKKNFQGRFIMSFLVTSLLGGVLAVLLFNFLAGRKIESVLYSMTLPAQGAGDILFREAVFANIVAVVFVIVMFLIVAGLIRRKVVRTLFRVRADLSGIQSGDLGVRVLLGEDDEFKELANEINHMTGELNNRFSEIKNHLQHLGESVRELACIMDEADSEMVQKKVTPHVDELEKEMRKFKR